MILIDEVLVSDDIINKHFACQLSACKGACCVEGDYGAPLEASEIDIIERIYPSVKPYMDKEAVARVEAQGFYTTDEKRDSIDTALMPDGACVFMGRNPAGITYCSIEKAYRDGLTDYIKPVSCHLYPVRVSTNKDVGFQALNYDRWDICNPACRHGQNNGIRIYEFVKEGLVRKFGKSFYEALEVIAEDLGES